ncbi:MAG: host attachment protein [Campylobacterales bacterium]|nr:host attachment protein [Campylobacterales bacterium]
MKLENTIVIVADLGELKAYKIYKNDSGFSGEFQNSYKLEMIVNKNFIEGRKKMGEMLSDSGGRMIHDTMDEHEAILEKDNRVLKDIVQVIEEIVTDEEPNHIFLAFPKEHNNQLVEKLRHDTKELIEKNIPSDLVKTDKSKLLSHFIG